MKRVFLTGISLALACIMLLGGCGSKPAASGTASSGGASPAESLPEPGKEPVKLLVAAAASLEYSFTERLIPMFQTQYPWITVEGAYDSSGKLQAQIEEGLEADVFMSAAAKQMNALKEESLIDADSVVELLENKIVLIVPASAEAVPEKFEDVAGVGAVALGDPESVPAGQYAKEALTALGLWDAVSAKASFGTNVTEVLNWVAEGSADAGIVYATDAATTDKVKVVAAAPDGSLAKKVLYPAGMVAASAHPEEARLFLEFLQTDGALAVFEEYGFAPNK